MNTRTRRTLALLGSFVLAGVLLALALQGVDFNKVWTALQDADYRWLLPIVMVVLVSHLLRAWRWQVLVEALPECSETKQRVSLKTAFYSLMIGYMVNYTIPRFGEVVRSANLASNEKISFSGVLGTVVVERLLDAVVLLLWLASVVLLLLDRSTVLQDLFITPMMEQIEQLPVLLIIGTVAGLGALGLLILRRALRDETSKLGSIWAKRVRPILASFTDGLRTLWRTPRRGIVVFTTLGMWFCYVLMAHLPFYMLNMAAPYDVSLVDSWIIMNLGAVGIAIPSPAGIGSFHYITTETLVHLFAFDRSDGFSYAVISHAAQMILYVIVGFVCMILQGSSIGSLRQTTDAAQKAETDLIS